MFQAAASSQLKVLRLLGERFYHEHEDYGSSIWCLEHVFSASFNIRDASSSAVSTILHSFLVYIKALLRASGHPDPCHDRHLAKLLGFREVSPHMFVVYSGTPLASFAKEVRKHSGFDSQAQDEVILHGPDLHRIIKMWIPVHIRLRGSEENIACRRSRVFFPCVPYVALGTCGRSRAQCYNEHVQSLELTGEWFTARLRIVLQQVMVYQAHNDSSRRKQTRFVFPSEICPSAIADHESDILGIGSMSFTSHSSLQATSSAQSRLSTGLIYLRLKRLFPLSGNGLGTSFSPSCRAPRTFRS